MLITQKVNNILEDIMKYNSGIYKQQYKYKSFFPALINKPYKWDDPKINVLLEDARGALGELNAFSKLIPDIDFFITMHVTKEATDSSKIEGTQTEIDEVMLPIEDIAPERKDDWQEIQNYISAMHKAINTLEELPISMRLICKTHKSLLKGVRGKNKLPGEVRKTQNWVGGSSIMDAKFIPPHPDDLAELLSDLEKFINNPNLEMPELIKIAITHYQFETIHPFCDGNGRMGRLLITLQLIEKGFLDKPTLYISTFFAKNKELYYSTLSSVRESGDMEHWIKFFLSGVLETSQSSIDKFKQIIKIKEETEKKLLNLGARAKLGKELLNLLYSSIIIDTTLVAKKLNLTYPRANRIINDFLELGILKELSKKRLRNKKFYFEEYMSLFID